MGHTLVEASGNALLREKFTSDYFHAVETFIGRFVLSPSVYDLLAEVRINRAGYDIAPYLPATKYIPAPGLKTAARRLGLATLNRIDPDDVIDRLVTFGIIDKPAASGSVDVPFLRTQHKAIDGHTDLYRVALVVGDKEKYNDSSPTRFVIRSEKYVANMLSTKHPERLKGVSLEAASTEHLLHAYTVTSSDPEALEAIDEDICRPFNAGLAGANILLSGITHNLRAD